VLINNLKIPYQIFQYTRCVTAWLVKIYGALRDMAFKNRRKRKQQDLTGPAFQFKTIRILRNVQ